MASISEVLHMAAQQTVSNSQLGTFEYGVVRSVAPLNIQVEQKANLTLGNAQIALSEAVRDVTRTITIDGENKSVVFRNALKIGDRVAMVRQEGGQQFLVVSRVV